MRRTIVVAAALVVAVIAVVIVLAFNADPKPEETRDQAVQDVLQAFGESDVETPKATRLLESACTAMDDYTPAEIMQQFDNDLDLPPVLAEIILDNSSSGFCPEHREAVLDYLDN